MKQRPHWRKVLARWLAKFNGDYAVRRRLWSSAYKIGCVDLVKSIESDAYEEWGEYW